MAGKEMRISSWKQESRKCLVCGTMFFPRQISQKYCSPECCRYANRHGGRAFGGTVIVSDPHKPALRIFTCKHCGEEVRVTEENDMRTKFSRSAVKICTGSIPSGRSGERRNHAAFTAEIVGKK